MERFARHYLLFTAVFALSVASLATTVGVARLSAAGIEYSLAQTSVTRAVVQIDTESQAAALTASVRAESHQRSQRLSDFATDSLRKAKSYRQASSKDKAATLKNLRTSLQTRKAAMLQAIKDDPESFLVTALPDSVVKQLPSEVSDLVEKNVEVEGSLTVVHIDYKEEGRDEFIYTIADKKSGKNYNLRFSKKGDPAFLTGAKVKTKGIAVDSELVLAETPLLALLAAEGAPAGPDSAPIVNIAQSLGEQRTLVILLNFTDNAVQPVSKDAIAQAMFASSTSVTSHYLENSYGKTWFTGDVVPWFTVPYKASDGCSQMNLWEQSARNAAASAGYNISLYKKILFMWPSVNSCGWGGSASVGGGGAQVQIGGKTAPLGTMIHELGHTLGFMHSNKITCGAKQIDSYSNCTKSEYGDPSDPMGGADMEHSNAPHKLAIPWIPASNVQAVTASGVYTISPSETLTSGIQVLRITKADTDEAYYISYRQPIGLDATLPVGLFGSQIHIWKNPTASNYYQATYLADATPGDNTASNASLTDGRSFQDLANGITVTQQSHTPTAATIAVTFGPISCVPLAPAVEVTPLSQSGSANQPLTYTVAVTNNDSYACSSTNFSVVTSDLPADFSFPSASSSLIAPGRTVNFPVKIISSGVVSDGSYPFTITAADSANPSRSTSVQASYVAVNDVQAPLLSLVGVTNGSYITGVRTITASTTDNLAIQKVEFLKDGAVSITKTTAPYTFSWNTLLDSDGGHTVQLKSYDFAGNVSSTNIFSAIVDNTLPSIVLTAPLEGATISGNITLTASSTDAIGVSNVKFYVDEKLVNTDSSSPYSFLWSNASATAGTHTVRAVATDKALNTVSSPSVTVSLTNGNTDTQPPVVSFTLPSNGATVTSTSTVRITATDNGSISRIELYRDGTLLSTGTASPYIFLWNTKLETNGAHSLQAKVYDGGGNIGVSNLYTVTVSNVIPVPAPTNAKATPVSSTQINLSWSVAAGVTRTRVMRNDELIAMFSTPTVSISDKELKPGTLYAYTLQAQNAAGTYSAITYISTTTPPDTILPLTAITSPVNGASVSGITTVSATASDSSGITKVELYLDNSLFATDTTTPYSFSWNTATSTKGSHTLQTKSYDAAGNIGSSNIIAVSVPNGLDATAPSTPQNLSGSAVSINQINLNWNSSTDNVAVTGYKVFRNNVQVATTTATNYSNTALAASTTYTFRVAAFDAAGNTSAQSNILSISTPAPADTTLPTTSITSPTNGATVSNTVTVSANASDNIGVTKVEFYRDGTLFSTDTSSPYSVSLDTTALTNGSHTLQTKSYDAANNVSSSAVITVTVSNIIPDTTVPSVPTGLTGSALSSTQINLSWSASTDNIGVTGYKLFRNGVQIATPVGTSFSNTTVSPSTTYTYTVAAYDAAGNTSAQSSGVVVTTPASTDTTAPSITLTSPTDGKYLAGSGNVTASASDNVGVTKVEFYRDGVVFGVDTTSPYLISWSKGTLADGPHVIQSKAYDAAGNSTLSAGVTIILDTMPPELTITSPANGATLGAGDVTISASASDTSGIYSIGITIDNVLKSSCSTTTTCSYVWKASTITTGPHTIKVETYDNSSPRNMSTVTLMVTKSSSDITAPSVPAGLTGSAISSTQIDLSWGASTDAVGVVGYKLFRNGVQIATPVGTSFSNTTVTPSTTYTYTVAAYDAAGNTSAQAPSITITTPAPPDTTPPTTSIVTPTTGSTVSNTVSVTASASDNVGITKVEFYVDGALKSTTSSPYTYSLDTKAMTNGPHTLQTKAYDAANNVGNSSIVTVTVSNMVVPPSDTTAPSITLTSPTDGKYLAGSGNVTASASDNVGVTKVEFYRDGVVFGVDTTSPYLISWSKGTLADGPHVIQSKAYDAAGNSTLSAGVTIILDTMPPELTITSPANGATLGAGDVTISASASDTSGIYSIGITIDNVLKSSCSTTTTCSYVWKASTITTGPHTIKVETYDNSSPRNTKAVTITVTK